MDKSELVALSDQSLLEYEQSLITKKYADFVRMKSFANDKVIGRICRAVDEGTPLDQFLPDLLSRFSGIATQFQHTNRLLSEVSAEWERRAKAHE